MSAQNESISPIGRSTARVTIEGTCYPVEFVVLRSCCFDIILGWDFLRDNAAVIDCAHSELQLAELPQIDSAEPADSASVKMRVNNRTVLPPRSTSFVSVISSVPHLASRSNALMEPNVSRLSTKGLIAPHVLVRPLDGATYIPVTNLLNEPVCLPPGFVAAHLEDTHAVHGCLSPVVAESSAIDAPVEEATLTNMISADLDEAQHSELLALLTTYAPLFDFRCPSLGVAKRVSHHIDTGDSPPLRQAPYRVSASERKIIEREVDDMLSKNVIRPSCSPWASPVVLVTKKDGTIRFCVDYRRLNKITRKDVYPMPRIDDALDALHGATYFSSLDMRSGYWQVPMHKPDIDKTAFTTPDGLYEFTVMPFGLSNAPATFERMMDTVLRGLRWSVCLCYLDDVVVYSATFSEHLHRLRLVLDCFATAGLQLNHKKCHFAHREIKVLGHIVSQKGVSPDPDKLSAVAHFPQPTNAKQLRSFFGLCSYFRRFIRGFANIAAPLSALLSKDAAFHWSPDCEKAFNNLKSTLTTAPVLRLFRPNAPTELHTDASGIGIGAVLAQRFPGEPMEHAVTFASRLLTKAERNYTTTEKECLAIVWAIGKLRPYLYGNPFTVVTDHHALCWLTSLKDPSGRLGRWVIRLQEFDITIKFKSGRKHSDADALSRCPLTELEQEQDPLPDDDMVYPLCPLTSYDPAHIREEQLKDPQLSRLIHHLEGTHTTTPKIANKSRNFLLDNGILYKQNYCPDGDPHLLAVPSSLRRCLLTSLHDDPTAGHLGFYKTFDRLRKRYFWPRMYTTVQKYVKSCLHCQRRKPSPLPTPGLLQPLSPCYNPFERVGIDLFGPLPITPSGNRWVVVAIDHCTRYVETMALPRGTSEEIAKFFITHLLLRHGAPRVLVSDRGRSFLAQLLQDVLRACSVIHRPTSAYHPQTNGLTERFNHTLSDMLAFYVSADHDNWDSVLPYVTYAYNTAVQSTTQFSPFRLLYNREPLHTVDTLFPFPPATTNVTLEEATSRAEECRQLARCRTFDHQAASKSRYDSHHRHVAYNQGDLVWLWVPQRKPGLCEKLICNYSGPYRVLNKLSDVTYLLEPLQPPTDRRYRGTQPAHVSRLKPYIPPSDPTSL